MTHVHSPHEARNGHAAGDTAALQATRILPLEA